MCGARLAARPHWPLARLADRLADKHRLLDELRLADLDVRARLTPGFLALPEQGRRALLALSELESASFSIATAADVLDLPPIDTQDLLDDLIEAHMVRVDPVCDERYRVPNLVAALAGQRGRLLRDAG